jgi:hypothetical protein
MNVTARLFGLILRCSNDQPGAFASRDGRPSQPRRKLAETRSHHEIGVGERNESPRVANRGWGLGVIRHRIASGAQ